MDVPRVIPGIDDRNRVPVFIKINIGPGLLGRVVVLVVFVVGNDVRGARISGGVASVRGLLARVVALRKVNGAKCESDVKRAFYERQSTLGESRIMTPTSVSHAHASHMLIREKPNLIDGICIRYTILISRGMYLIVYDTDVNVKCGTLHSR